MVNRTPLPAPPSSRVALLADVATRLLTEDRPEDIVHDLFVKVAEHLDLDFFINYFVTDASTLALHTCAGISVEQADSIARLGFNEGVCGTVAATRTRIVVEHAQHDSTARTDLIRAFGARAYACHPLLGNRGIVGTLSFGSRRRDSFTSEELDVMRTVANQVAIAVERRLALAQLQSELQARNRIERETREANERYERLFGVVREGFAHYRAIYDGDTLVDLLVVEINAAGARLSGVPAEKQTGRTWRQVWPNVDEALFARYQQADRTGEVVRFDDDNRLTGKWYDVAISRVARGEFVVTFTDITDRKLAFDALQGRERDLARAQAAAHLGSWTWHLATDAVSWSDELYRIFGVDPATFVPSNAAAHAMIHPDDRARHGELVGIALTGRTVAAFESRIIRPNGEERLVVASGFQVQLDDRGKPVKLFGTVQDVTDRRLAEDALRKSEQLLQKAFSIETVGVLFFSLYGRMTGANEAFLRMTGYTREELLASVHWKVLTAPEFLEATGRRAEDLATRGETAPYEKQMVRKDGSLWWALCAPTRLTGTAANGECVEFIIDVTERRRAEEALRDADRRKDEFIAVLSHELRNPLAPIRYALPLLQREALSDSGERAVSVIDRQLDHLTRLVDDLLDVSRITRGKIDLKREHLTAASVVTAAVEAASPGIIAARHHLNVRVPDEPTWAYGDRTRLAQALTNLLNNAARYTPRGGEITVEVERDDSQVAFRVRDTGVGIPSEELPGLFELFRQGAQPDRSRGGLGIGLGLVKQLIQMHGGTVEAHSEGVGHGAEFVIRLPIAPEEPGIHHERVTSVTAGEGRRLKVLIVDDNADLVEMLATLVATRGHDVRKALDGRSAVSAALSYRPDVVLLDVGLPVMSGIEVARELRRRAETARAKLIALTGWGQADDRRQTQEAGFDCHLTKPADPRLVEQMLREYAAEGRNGGD